MGYRIHGHHSATMQAGITPPPARVDLNAFVIVCFVWRAPRQPQALPEPKPGALARAA